MLKSALSAFAMLLGLFFAANCPAQGTEELPRSKQLPTSKTHEIWYGVVEGPFQHLRNAFYWNAGTDVKDGIVYSIDDDQVLQLTHVSKTDNALSFDIPDISARFVGTLAEGKLAIGHWKVQGMSLPMKLERVDALPEDRPELILKNLSLNKEGQPEMSFRVYDLKPDGKGMRSDRVFLDVPAAGKRGYLANYREVDGTITIEALGPKLSLTGSIDSTSERLQGVCKIDGKEYTIALSVRKFAPSPPPSLDAKSSNDPSVARDSNLTNDGKKGESVDRKLERDGVFAIESLSDASKREWTFRFPDIDKKYPTIILIGGTGTQDRTQTIGDHRPLRWLEEYLLKNRYGVVRLKEPPRDAPKIENSGYASVHDRAVELSKVCQEVAKNPLVDGREVGFSAIAMEPQPPSSWRDGNRAWRGWWPLPHLAFPEPINWSGNGIDSPNLQAIMKSYARPTFDCATNCISSPRAVFGTRIRRPSSKRPSASIVTWLDRKQIASISIRKSVRKSLFSFSIRSMPRTCCTILPHR